MNHVEKYIFVQNKKNYPNILIFRFVYFSFFILI